jgi:hypothetical protein
VKSAIKERNINGGKEKKLYSKTSETPFYITASEEMEDWLS